ncbi:MAG: HD domain-containing protein [Clostridia bacterium]
MFTQQTYTPILTTADAIGIVKRTLRMIDKRLIDHGERVAYLVYNMLTLEDLSQSEIGDICIAAAFHDIGAYKTEEIDRMTQFEMGDVINHSIYGYLFLKHLSPLGKFSEAVLYHHSRYDKLEHMSIKHKSAALLIHLCDKLDLLASAFPNSDKFPEQYIREQSGKIFHPQQVDNFLALNHKLHLLDKLRDGSFAGHMLDYFASLNFSISQIGKYLFMMVCSIDFRSEYTVAHTITTQSISVELSRRLGYRGETLAKIFYGAMLHDIGKISTPLEILEKRGELTAQEYAIMQEHVVNTRNILSSIVDHDVCELASRHHERIDGSGYPLGLTAAMMSEPEEIIAVADVISALCGKRSYKESVSDEAVIAILTDEMECGRFPRRICELAIAEYADIMAAVSSSCKPILDMYKNLVGESDRLCAMFNRWDAI